MVNAIPEDQVDAPLPPSDKKYDMSCVMNYECIDVYDMANYAETEKFCMDNYCNDPVKEDCGYNSFPCSAPIEYGCIKNGVCTTIQAMRDNDMYYAKGKCRLTCGAVKAGKSCITEAVEACPAPIIEKPDPLAGADVDALKGLANKNANKGNFSSPVVLINRAIKMLMAFIGSIALVLYIYSGFMWMTASGNAERVTKAKTTMVWTTLGVLMMLASYMLASFLFKSLGV